MNNPRDQVSPDHGTETAHCSEKDLRALCGLCYEESVLSTGDANSV